MDVINLHPAVNRKVRCLFNIIDVYSRHLWSFPITNKRTASLFEKWLKSITKTPNSLNSDDGKEWAGAFKTLLKKNNIEHYISIDEDEHHNKQAIIERVHRTLRNLMQRCLDIYNTKKYIDILPKLIDNYNNTYHTTLKTTPEKVLAGARKHKQKINRAKFIPIGSKVRTTTERCFCQKYKTVL